MAQEANSNSELLEVEINAHQATKDELELIKRRLASATEARVYVVTKASQQMAETVTEINQLKEEYKEQLEELRAKHIIEQNDTDDELLRLRARVRTLENNNDELYATKEKLLRYNEQQEHNVKSLRLRLKTANHAQPRATDQLAVLSPVPGGKRTTNWDEELADEDHDYPCHKKPKTPIVACTQCITHNWEDCDGGASCQNCVLRMKADCCKRVMCKRFKKHTCSNLFCALAHEDGGFKKLVPFTHLQECKKKMPSPLEMSATRAAKSKERAIKKGSESESMYDGLFEDLAKDRRRKRDGGDDGSLAA